MSFGGLHHTPPVLLNDCGSASAPVSLLVESLVQQLCSLLETDTTKSKNLYKNVCAKLEQMKLIDQTWSKGEFDVMRTQYQKALYQLVQVAKGPEMLLPPAATATAKTAAHNEFIWPLQQPVGMDWSRYHRDFEELCFIAGGGFGKVYRARNKLDGTMYAIKKVIIRAKSLKKVFSHLDEVKTLASLHHVNIVPYKTAWLEPLLDANAGEPIDLEDEEDDSELDGSMMTEPRTGTASTAVVQETQLRKSHRTTTDYSDSVVFRNSDGGSEAKDEVWSTHMSFEETREDETTEEISSKAVCHYGGGGGRERFQLGTELQQPCLNLNWAVLYIQMSECHLTLRTWLDDRNQSPSFSEFYHRFLATSLERNRSSSSLPSPTVVLPGDNYFSDDQSEAPSEPCDLEVISEIFSQLISGLTYIHARDIIHHDIKPSNIFISVDHGGNIVVQLGDFGLACPLQQRHANKIVGTPQYAAPEQLKGHCDKKSDIYSLGVILLELLVCFSTEMERNLTIKKAKGNEFPESVPQPYPALLWRLLSSNVDDRPDCFELTDLYRRIRSSRDPVVETLQKKLWTQDEEIAELRALMETKQQESQSRDDELSQKEREITQLKKRLAKLEALGEKSQKHIQIKHHETQRLKKKLMKQRDSASDSDTVV